MISQMFWKVKLILFFNYYSIIGIGLIKKDSKNQIRLESSFYELYNENQVKNIIGLNEEENKNNIDNNKENEKLDTIINNKFKKLENELDFINNLIKASEKKLLYYRNCHNNNNTSDNNFNDNKNINFEKKSTKLPLEPNIFDLMNIFNLQIIEDNNLNINNSQNLNKFGLQKDPFADFIKEPNNNFLEQEYFNIFSNEINKKEVGISNNYNYSLGKDSLISDFFDIDNKKIFNCEKDNIFG